MAAQDFGWAAVLSIALGGFLIICGLSAIATSVWKRHQKKQRRNRRLYGFGNVYSTKDFK